MALALYRKYRPRTFAEVIGQEHVTEPLSQALRSGRLNHAYLFSGPRGCGKTSSARILARSLNCEHGPTPEPCGTCDSCRSLSGDGAGSLDVIEIDAASHGGVDDARELREKAFFAPANSRFKIYVIDEAHMVSSAGFNALLKLVEEPPEYVKFIFATTEPEKVLGTIKSRTHHYPFRLIPPKVLRPYLEQLTQAEGVQVEPAVFPLVVRAGGGSARDSLSVLDQLIAGAGPDGVSYARAAALLGVTDSALIDEMCDALAAGDGAAAYATVDRVAEAGHDPRRFASDLLERLRDLIVLQQVPDAPAKGLIDGPDDQIERMTAQAQRLGPATLSRCADIVHDGLVEMRGTTAPRLLLELICARMLLPGVDDTTGGLLQRLERMERRLTLAGTDAPPAAAGSAPPTDPATVRTQPPAPPAAAAASPGRTAGEPAAPDAHSGVAAARAAAAGAGTRGTAAPNGDARGTSAGNAGAQETAAGNAGAEEVAAPTDGARRMAGGNAGARESTAANGGQGAAAPAGGGPGAAGASPAGPTGAESARRPVPPSAVMPDPATPEPPRPGSVKPGVLDAVAVRRAWPEVVGKVNRSHKKIAALMRDAVVRDLDGDTLVLTVKSAVLARMMSDHAQVLTDALYEELGGRWQIRCEVAGERGGTSPGSPRAASGPAPAPSRPTPDTPPNGTVAGDGGRPHGAADPASSAGGAVSADEDEGWPEPARPGGSAPASTDAGAGDTEDGWPEAARPGGAAAGRDTSPNPGASAGSTSVAGVTPAAGAQPANGAPVAVASNGPQAGPTESALPRQGATISSPRVTGGNSGAGGNGNAGGRGGPRSAGAGGAPVSSAIAAARAAAAGRGARTAQAARQTADVEFAGEPPYDPDFDGPVRGGAGASGAAQPAATVAYEGFDPGDEPLDEIIDEKTARESSEEQAVRLLREAFAATEKIAESDNR
ncbi:DNA polymerase III subunit gamma and tau [Micromonospora sp. CA-263727]|uniref:DNA polymerase III subunit gamma and tau n=1 Tax=Micromonospora sp. CA-263727 TaxID=3239967 RepID=UPI003D9328A3